jgi:EmrB/QacA subfamily drug resistance transporter
MSFFSKLYKIKILYFSNTYLFEMLKIKRKWLVLIAVSSCIAMLYIDMVGVAVLLPTLQNLWGISDIGAQWIINSYVLTVAVLVAAGGRLSDIIGARKSFLIGMTGFLLSSMLCGIAPNFVLLLCGRILQGAFCAILLPTTSVNVINAFPPKEVGSAMGIYVGSGSIFLALGPFIAGFLTQYLSWRWVFFVNLPLSIVSFFLARFSMRKKEDFNKLAKREPFDWLGFAVLGLANTSLVIALMEGAPLGWLSPIVLGLFVLACCSYLGFFFLEKLKAVPLIDFTIFQSHNYKVCAAILFLMQICITTRIFLILLFQTAYGYTPVHAAFLILPTTLPLIFMAPVAGWLLQHFGPKIPIRFGVMGVLVSFISLLFFMEPGHYLALMLSLFLFGLSLPLAFNPSLTVALTSVNVKRRGVASGVVVQLRQLSSTFGIAVIGAILNSVSQVHFHSSVMSSSLASENLANLNVTDTLLNVAAVHAVVSKLTPAVHIMLRDMAMQSYLFGFRVSFIINTLFVVVAIFLAFFVLREQKIMPVKIKLQDKVL